MLKVLDIKAGTSVDGPGLRTAIYFSGCHHHCSGCHNPQSWDFDAGDALSTDEIMSEIEANGFNVTFTGGDPMARARELVRLADKIKEAGYTLWCYTGYLFEDLLRDPWQRELLNRIDVLVDGPFIAAQRDVSLLFRGSANQRLIDVKQSLDGHVVLWSDPEVLPL